MTTSRTRKTTSGSGDGAKKSSSSTKKAPRKRAPAKKASGQGSDSSSEGSSTPRKRASAPKAAARPQAKAGQIALEAARQLQELTGKEPESVTSLRRTDDGWQVQVEVVEVHRIPETTDVMALYELDVDEQGALEGYRRVRRYARGVPGED